MFSASASLSWHGVPSSRGYRDRPVDLLREILQSSGLVLLAHLADGLRTVLRRLENPSGLCRRFARSYNLSARPTAEARQRDPPVVARVPRRVHGRPDPVAPAHHPARLPTQPRAGPRCPASRPPDHRHIRQAGPAAAVQAGVSSLTPALCSGSVARRLRLGRAQAAGRSSRRGRRPRRSLQPVRLWTNRHVTAPAA